MIALIRDQVETVGRWWRAVRVNQGEGDFALSMWLVTVPAVALAVVSRPVVRIPTSDLWMNRLGLFATMVFLATLYAVPVMAVLQRAAARGRTSQIMLLSCWWIGAGAAVWMSAGWMAAMAGGAGGAVLLHLMVRQVDAVRLPS